MAWISLVARPGIGKMRGAVYSVAAVRLRPSTGRSAA
jgi:hypothetical protein